MVFCNCKLSHLKSRKLNHIPYPAFKLQIKRKETEQIVLSQTGGHSAIPPTHHENENTDNDNTSKGQQQKYSIGTVSKKYWGRGGGGGGQGSYVTTTCLLSNQSNQNVPAVVGTS